MLIFHHIPKTGGTSVIDALVTAGLKHKAIRPEHFTSYKPTVYPSTELLSSHWFHESKGKHFTILRNPVDMFFSFYFYIKRSGEIWNYNPLIEYQTRLVLKCDTIKDYINHESQWKFPRYQFDDLATMDFVGILEKPQSTIDWFRSIGIKVKNIGHYHKGNYDEKVSSEMIKSIENNLSIEIEIYFDRCS